MALRMLPAGGGAAAGRRVRRPSNDSAAPGAPAYRVRPRPRGRRAGRSQAAAQPGSAVIRVTGRRGVGPAFAQDTLKLNCGKPAPIVKAASWVDSYLPVTPSGRVLARPARGAEGASSPQPLRRQDRTGQASLKLAPWALTTEGEPRRLTLLGGFATFAGARSAGPGGRPPGPPDGGFAAGRLTLLGGFATFAGARSASPGGRPPDPRTAASPPGVHRLTDPSAQEAPGWSTSPSVTSDPQRTSSSRCSPPSATPRSMSSPRPRCRRSPPPRHLTCPRPSPKLARWLSCAVSRGVTRS